MHRHHATIATPSLIGRGITPFSYLSRTSRRASNLLNTMELTFGSDLSSKRCNPCVSTHASTLWLDGDSYVEAVFASLLVCTKSLMIRHRWYFSWLLRYDGGDDDSGVEVTEGFGVDKEGRKEEPFET
jgi:hypothetical protein